MSERVVDPDTGEMKNVITIPENAHIYIRNKQNKQQTSSSNEKVLRDQRKFTKAYTNAWRSVFENSLFTHQESHTLLFLGAYCEPESNAVVGEDGKLMSIRDIADRLGWSEKNMRRILKSLEMKNAIAKGTTMGDDRYFVNPVLFGNGVGLNKTTIRLFETEKERRIEQAKGMLSFLRVGRMESTIVILSESD